MRLGSGSGLSTRYCLRGYLSWWIMLLGSHSAGAQFRSDVEMPDCVEHPLALSGSSIDQPVPMHRHHINMTITLTKHSLSHDSIPMLYFEIGND
jgi:hypothetical protein